MYTIESGVRRYRAHSSDEKPLRGVPDGSTWLEKDTGKRFIFDEGSADWYPMTAGGGGGTPSGPIPISSVQGLQAVLDTIPIPMTAKRLGEILSD